MTNLKTLKMAFLLAAATLASGAASAQVNFNVPSNLPVPQSTLTRAEVIADLLISKASGLYDLNHQGEPSVDTNSLAYAQATARYQFMRASPQFAVLVSQVSRGAPTTALIAAR